MMSISMVTLMMSRLLCLFLILAPVAYGEEASESSNPVAEVVSGSLERLEAFKNQLHVWDRTTRGFRLGHNISIYVGRHNGFWRVNGKLSGPNGDEYYVKDYQTTAISWGYQYTYHIQIKDSFGYYLGSSLGVIFNETSTDKNLRIERTLMFPGIVIGLVYNLSPAFRFWMGVDAQLLRYERFVEKGNEGGIETKTQTYFNAHSIAYQVGGDFFFQLRWALNAHWEEIRVKNNKLAESEGALLGFSREKHLDRYLFGVTYHLL